MRTALWIWLGLAAAVALVVCARLWRRLGSRLVLASALPPALLVLALANFMGPLERRSWMVDVTKNRRNTLSSITEGVVDRAREEVRITAFFVPGEPGWETASAVIKAYERLSPRVKVRFVNPEQQPGLARKYEIEFFGQVVIEGAGRRERANFADEIDVTGAILRLTRDRAPRLCFVTGHGERVPDEITGLNELGRALDRSQMEFKTVSLARATTPLEGCDAAVVLGAKVPLLPEERDRWRAYLGGEGKAMVLLEAGGPDMSAWLPAGISVGEQPVSDAESGLVDDPEAVVAGIFGASSAITRDLAPVFLLNPLPLAIDRDPQGEGGVSIAKLLITTPTARIGDRQGTLLLAAGYDRSGIVPDGEGGRTRISRSRVFVLGDVDWVLDGQVELLDNRRLLGNALEWLVRQENLIDIASRPVNPPVLLTSSDSRSVLLSSVVLPPAVLLTIGVVVAWARRKR